MSAKKIAITNEKGGCGKTTTAVNVSAILAERGYRVLLIDADPQSYSTMYYGLYAPENLSLSDVLFHGEKPEQAISSTEFGVDVLRSSTALMAAEELMDQRKMNGQRYPQDGKERLQAIFDAAPNDTEYRLAQCKNGLDMETPAGKLAYDSWGYSWGYYVKINHSSVHDTLYAHMSRLVVHVGQYVRQGELIGYVGNTGNSSGSHLHFELYLNGTRVDPEPYIGTDALQKYLLSNT